MVKFRLWVEARLNLPSSSLLRTLSNRERQYFILTQVALTFAIGSIYWALLVWWAGASLTLLPSGEYTFVIPAFYYNSILLFAMPLVLCVAATTVRPEKIIIAPTDVSAVAFGIAAVSLLHEVPLQTPTYFLQLFFLSMYLVLATVIQNQIVLRLVGIQGSAETISVDQYQTETDPMTLTNLLRSEVYMEAMGILGERDVDGATIFRGLERDYEFHIGVSPFPNLSNETTQAKRTLISIVGYERDRLGLRKTQASTIWFRGKCSSLVTVLAGAVDPITREQVAIESWALVSGAQSVETVPEQIREAILAPTRNVMSRFTELGESAPASIFLLAVALAVTAYLMATNIVSEENGFVIVLLVLLSQVGRLRLRRKEKHQR